MAEGAMMGPMKPRVLENAIKTGVSASSWILKHFPARPIDYETYEFDVYGKLAGKTDVDFGTSVFATSVDHWTQTDIMGWSKVHLYQSRASKLRTADPNFFQYNVDKAVEWHAAATNNTVMAALAAGGYTNNAYTAPKVWTASGVPNDDATVEKDIATFVGYLRTYGRTGTLELDSAKVHMIVPADTYAALNVAVLSSDNRSTKLKTKMEDEHNMVIHYSQDFTGSEYLTDFDISSAAIGNNAVGWIDNQNMENVMKVRTYSEKAARAKGAPLVEQEYRADDGWHYYSTKGLVATIVPFEDSASTNKNIGVLSTVRS